MSSSTWGAMLGAASGFSRPLASTSMTQTFNRGIICSSVPHMSCSRLARGFSMTTSSSIWRCRASKRLVKPMSVSTMTSAVVPTLGKGWRLRVLTVAATHRGLPSLQRSSSSPV